MKSLVRLLNSPMRDSCDLKESAKTFFFIGLFVAFFLWFFKPFGFDNVESNRGLYALGFGGVTFVAGFLVEFVEIKILRIRKDLPGWTFWKWLRSILILILCITAGNYLFNSYLSGFYEFSFGALIRFFINTLAIGIFPITLFGIWNLRRTERHYSQLASSIKAPVPHPADTHEVVLPSRTGDDIVVRIGDILYLEASQNYVTIHLLENDTPERRMIRNTIKEISGQLAACPDIIRCHRSFLVNLDQVKEVTGNSQGLILHLAPDKASQVPVSRTYIPAVRHRLETFS